MPGANGIGARLVESIESKHDFSLSNYDNRTTVAELDFYSWRVILHLTSRASESSDSERQPI
jgi:hypothetical protein